MHLGSFVIPEEPTCLFEMRLLEEFREIAVILRRIGNDDLSPALQSDPAIVDHNAEEGGMRDNGIEILSLRMTAQNKVWLHHYSHAGTRNLPQRIPRC